MALVLESDCWLYETVWYVYAWLKQVWQVRIGDKPTNLVQAGDPRLSESNRNSPPVPTRVVA